MSVKDQARHSKEIKFSGVINFRDLGGIQTKDGRTIKKGILFRSADLTDLTPEDKDKWREMGIQTVYDFRTANEANSRPDPQIENVKYVRQSVNLEESNQEYTSLEDYFKSGDAESFGNELLVQLYESIPVSNKSYKQLMDLIKKPAENLPLLQHCTGGRDRTGIGTMLVLLTLGVEWEVVLEDYLYSNVTLEKYHNDIFDKIADKVSAKYLEAFKVQFLLQERYLNMALQNILTNYKDIETFLAEEYEITEEVRKEIQDFCLE